MIKLDESKLISLKQLHWEWFWTRAIQKKISFSLSSNSKCSISIKRFFEFFFDWYEDDLKKIIFADSSQIKNFADKNSLFFKDFKKKFDLLSSQNYFGSSNTLQKILLDAFGYDDFIDGIKRPFQAERSANSDSLMEWCSYMFTEQLGVDVCPYCNRQYVFTLKKGNGRPEIDHFYPKSEYPYLSCTLSNFIPSCHQCNHQKSDDFNVHVMNKNNLKKDIYYVKNRSLTIYPYQDGFDSLGVKFRIKYANTLKKSIYFNISQRKNSMKWKMVRNSIKAFHLKELYNCQQIEINDLLKRYENYARPKIKDILRTVIYPSLDEEINDLKAKLAKLNNTEEYVRSFLEKVVETYIEDTKKEILGIPLDNDDGKEFPFRKFKEDIVEQLDEERLKNFP